MDDTFSLDKYSTIGKYYTQEFFATLSQLSMWMKSSFNQDSSSGQMQSEYRMELLNRFQFESEPNVIIRFLEQNPFLLPIIFEAEKRIEILFKNSDEEGLKLLGMRLEKFANPGTNEEIIVLTIVLDATPAEAFERFNNLRNSWWLKTIDEAHWKLMINIDFI
jgi:hypothetical protein